MLQTILSCLFRAPSAQLPALNSTCCLLAALYMYVRTTRRWLHLACLELHSLSSQINTIASCLLVTAFKPRIHTVSYCLDKMLMLAAHFMGEHVVANLPILQTVSMWNNGPLESEYKLCFTMCLLYVYMWSMCCTCVCTVYAYVQMSTCVVRMYVCTVYAYVCVCVRM